MKIIFVGTKNFNFFSKDILNGFEKIILTTKEYKLPEDIVKHSTIIRVNEIFDHNSKSYKLNTDECIMSVKGIINKKSDVRVFCNQEANLEVAEEIRKYFNIYDHMESRVKIFRDKVMMKSVLLNSKLRVPTFTALDHHCSIEDYLPLFDKLKGDFVIKPSSSVGSRGVYKIFNEKDFMNFIEDTKNDSCHFEAEEFIRGELYEFDTAMQNGKILYSNVSKYSCPMADLQEGRTIGSIMIERSEEIHKRITIFGRQCLSALNASNGCFHMELFHTINDELVFLEIAARSPGLMAIPAYQRWEGINMYDLELLIQCGLPAGDLVYPSEYHISRPSFWIVYPKIAGTVSEINVPTSDAEYDIDWQVRIGDVVTDTTTNIDYAARFFVTCKNVDDAMRTFIWLTEEFKAITYTI